MRTRMRLGWRSAGRDGSLSSALYEYLLDAGKCVVIDRVAIHPVIDPKTDFGNFV